jgi:hypothetical protein
MIQEIVIGIIFLGALFYIGGLVYKNLTAKQACATGCSKCGALDLAKIEADIKARGL